MVLLQWVSDHLAVVGFCVSEAIALMPGIKSNSVVQLIVNIVKDLSKQISDKLSA